MTRITSLLLTAFLCGCSESASDRDSAALGESGSRSRTILDLAWISPPHDLEPATYRTFDLGPGLPPECSMQRGEAVPLPPLKPGDKPLLSITGDRPRLRFEGPFDPVQFTHVALTFRNRSDVEMRIALVIGGKPASQSRLQRYGKALDGQTVLVALPDLRRQRDPLEAFELLVPYQHKDLLLDHVALIRMPLSASAPEPAAPRHMMVGVDSRPAVGLLEGAPLATRFAASKGMRFEIALGQPTTLRQLEDQMTVKVAMRAGDRHRTETITLGAADTRNVPWRRFEYAVDEFSGKDVEVEVSLESTAAQPSICYVTPPSVFTPGAEKAIVLVTSDTHRADHFGLSPSNVGVKTPFLDGLAESGVFFQDAWASINITNPSHAALMTGLHPRDHGVINNITPMSESAVTLAERFQAAGYTTLAALSAPHMLDERSGLGQGFDRVSIPAEPNKRDSADTIAVLEKMVAEHAGRPLFVWLHVFDAHGPYNPPEEYVTPYYPTERDPRDTSLPELAPDIVAWWQKDVRDVDYIRAQYKGEVSYLDRQLQQFLSLPRFVDQLIAVTADHGEHLGEQGRYWEHETYSPFTLAVPMLINGPGVSPGTVVTDPVKQWDLARTMLELAGLDATDFPGASLLDEVTRKGPRFGIASHGRMASIQQGPWFLTLYLLDYKQTMPPRTLKRHSCTLYDLTKDPLCLEDLAWVEEGTARKLRGALVQWLADGSRERLARPPQALDGEAIEVLAGLGYALVENTFDDSAWIDPACECSFCKRFGE